MNRLFLTTSMLLAALLIGCSTTISRQSGKERKVYTSVGSSEWKADSEEKESKSLSASSSTETDAIAALTAQIEAQNEEVKALKELLQQQSRQNGERIGKLEANLDLHLELLGLYYQKLSALQEGKPAPDVVAPNSPASVNGRVYLPISGQTVPIGALEISLFKASVIEKWNTASSPKTLYTSPLRNPSSLLRNLDPGETDSSRPNSEGASNSRVSKYEGSLEASELIAQSTTDAEGRFLLSSVKTGSYLVYGRANTDTYTVTWLVPVLVRPGAIHELELNAENAQVFLNDIAE